MRVVTYWEIYIKFELDLYINCNFHVWFVEMPKPNQNRPEIGLAVHGSRVPNWNCQKQFWSGTEIVGNGPMPVQDFWTVEPELETSVSNREFFYYFFK